MLNDPEPDNRADAIALIRKAKQEVTADLTQTMELHFAKEPNDYVREAYFHFFAESLPSKRAVDALEAAYRNAITPRVRAGLVNSIFCLRDGGKTRYDQNNREWNIIKALLYDALRDNDKNVRQNAARALGDLYFKGVDTETALATALDDSDVLVQQSAGDALCNVGVSQASTITALFRRMAGLTHVAVGSAASALATSEPPLLVPHIQRMKGILDEAVRRDDHFTYGNICDSLVVALGKLGGSAAPALASMKAYLRQAYGKTTRESLCAIEAIIKSVEAATNGEPYSEVSHPSRQTQSIHRAIEAGDAGCVKTLLADNPDLANSFDESGRYLPLTIAAYRGHMDIVRLLLDAGADVIGAGGFAPLHEAASAGHAGIVRLLLERGAAVDSLDEEGRTALFFATGEGRGEAAKVLILAGANVNHRSRNGVTVLMGAAGHGLGDIVQMLLDRGADPLIATPAGLTALSMAIQKGHAQIAELLLRSNPQSKSDFKQ